ncbi:MAG: hypothetical protein U0P30_18330 [Vicinamibacterales bacterium]
MTRRPFARRLAVVVLLLATRLASAQTDPQDHAHMHDAPAGATWTTSLEVNAFGGYNRQYRKFTDFQAFESQNWFMGSAQRASGPWTIALVAGGSLEPFTLDAIGSPQVFQTGETYRNAPLIDFQHPHDLVMHLGADVVRKAGRAEITAGAALVGGPPIGPMAFMHRASAIENPQVPLSHHQLDATHISQGVVHAAVAAAGVRLDAALFHGQEPDERRKDLDLGALDSQAVQLSYVRGGWSAQVSTAWLTHPERLYPTDARRHTASVSYARTDGVRLLAWTAAFGQNRESHGSFDAWLAEGTWRPAAHGAIYSRAEWLEKDILDAGFHPLGVLHRHRVSRVGALTLGGVVDVLTGRAGQLGVGADVSGYRVPANLREGYGSPLSVHVFVRYHLRRGDAHAHMH